MLLVDGGALNLAAKVNRDSGVLVVSLDWDDTHARYVVKPKNPNNDRGVTVLIDDKDSNTVRIVHGKTVEVKEGVHGSTKTTYLYNKVYTMAWPQDMIRFICQLFNE